MRGVYAPASGTLQSGAWLLVALPALGAAVLLVGGRRTDRWGHWLAVGLSWASFVWGAAAHRCRSWAWTPPSGRAI